MGILDLLDEVAIEVDFFEHHPVKLLSLEEQILYLQGLALIMGANENIDKSQKNYLALLIRSWELESSVLESVIAFCQQPEKTAVISFFTTFKEHHHQQNFIFDALMLMSKSEDKVAVDIQNQAFNKIANSLKTKSKTIDFLKTLLGVIDNEKSFNEIIGDYDEISTNKFIYLDNFYGFKIDSNKKKIVGEHCHHPYELQARDNLFLSDNGTENLRLAYSVKLRIVDNKGELGKLRYTTLLKRVIKVPVIQDPIFKDGVYVTGLTELVDDENSLREDTFFTFEEVEQGKSPFILHKTIQDASESSDIYAIERDRVRKEFEEFVLNHEREVIEKAKAKAVKDKLLYEVNHREEESEFKKLIREEQELLELRERDRKAKNMK